MQTLNMVVFFSEKDDERLVMDIIADPKTKLFGNRVMVSDNCDVKLVTTKLAESIAPAL